MPSIGGVENTPQHPRTNCVLYSCMIWHGLLSKDRKYLIRALQTGIESEKGGKQAMAATQSVDAVQCYQTSKHGL